MHRMRTFITLGLLWLFASLAGSAQDVDFVIGGGGPSFGIFMPDIDAMSDFSTGLGFPALEGNLLLIGGNGRGGLVPGLAFGGGGWGAWITASEGDLDAELGLGIGGFEVGYAVGGRTSAVGTVGLLIGMGGSDLTLSGSPFLPVPAPMGIIPTPTENIYNSVFLVLAPYVEFQIMLLDWAGLSMRAGYVWTPISYDWHDEGLPDAPGLALDGTYVSVTLVFGGIIDVNGDGQE